MKPSPSKSAKATRKKRGREEAAAAATGVAPPMSPPRADPSREWKKSKVKTEDLLALLNSGFIREKEVDMWRAAAGDPYSMEKAEDEIPMFARFVERGLALPASDFFKGLLGYYRVEYLNLNPNSIFHTAVFVHFCEAFLGIKPHWILFRKFFRVKPQPSATNPRVVGGAGIQLREDAAEQYLAYKLVDSNTDWKTRWFYITNHHPGLPKPSGRQPRYREWWNTEPTMQEGIQLVHQGAQGSGTEGLACGLQFHEAEGAATDGSRHLGLRVHWRRRHVTDARRRAGRQRHHREAVVDLQGYAAVHGMPCPGVLRRAPAKGGE
jgi:hypothetical protein